MATGGAPSLFQQAAERHRGGHECWLQQVDLREAWADHFEQQKLTAKVKLAAEQDAAQRMEKARAQAERAEVERQKDRKRLQVNALSVGSCSTGCWTHYSARSSPCQPDTLHSRQRPTGTHWLSSLPCGMRSRLCNLHDIRTSLPLPRRPQIYARDLPHHAHAGTTQ